MPAFVSVPSEQIFRAMTDHAKLQVDVEIVREIFRTPPKSPDNPFDRGDDCIIVYEKLSNAPSIPVICIEAEEDTDHQSQLSSSSDSESSVEPGSSDSAVFSDSTSFVSSDTESEIVIDD